MLPGIDDGARDLAYALEMACKAVACGTRKVVVTPHHMNGVYTNRRGDILAAVKVFQAELDRAGIELTVIPGSELHLTPELPEQLDSGEALTYADLGKAVLVELPSTTVPNGVEQILENILYRGITPVIAHPERNSELCSHPDRIADWAEQGCAFQLTAQSCTGLFGERIEAVSRYWCERGWIHLIASDAHRLERRSPDLRAAAATLRDWLGDEASQILIHMNPDRLTKGKSLRTPQQMLLKEKKGLFSKIKSEWF